MATTKGEQIPLTSEVIHDFLQDLSDRGRREGSLQNYYLILMGLYDYLPEDKMLSKSTVVEWRDWLNGQGYSERTVNSRLSTLNSLLSYLDRRDWQMIHFSRRMDAERQELTRAEYMRLLRAAKAAGKEKPYLLIKVLGGVGVRIQELSQITVEAVQAGEVMLECYNRKRRLRIPASFRKELLDFVDREDIRKGPVFVTQEGTPLIRSSIWKSVKSVCRDAHVDEGKVSPRSLWQMYQNTYDGIRSNIEALVDQAYEQMFDQEQVAVGWDA